MRLPKSQEAEKFLFAFCLPLFVVHVSVDAWQGSAATLLSDGSLSFCSEFSECFDVIFDINFI